MTPVPSKGAGRTIKVPRANRLTKYRAPKKQFRIPIGNRLGVPIGIWKGNAQTAKFA